MVRKHPPTNVLNSYASNSPPPPLHIYILFPTKTMPITASVRIFVLLRHSILLNTSGCFLTYQVYGTPFFVQLVLSPVHLQVAHELLCRIAIHRSEEDLVNK